MTTAPNPYSVSVAAAVLNEDGQVLLLQRPENGRWELPGGILEQGETITAGLQRELLEETGLDIMTGPLTGVYQNMRLHVVALVFRCSIRGGTLTTNDEADAFYWADRDEIGQIMAEAFASRLVDALETADQQQAAPPVRFHDGQRLLPS